MTKPRSTFCPLRGNKRRVWWPRSRSLKQELSANTGQNLNLSGLRNKKRTCFDLLSKTGSYAAKISGLLPIHGSASSSCRVTLSSSTLARHWCKRKQPPKEPLFLMSIEPAGCVRFILVWRDSMPHVAPRRVMRILPSLHSVRCARTSDMARLSLVPALTKATLDWLVRVEFHVVPDAPDFHKWRICPPIGCRTMMEVFVMHRLGKENAFRAHYLRRVTTGERGEISHISGIAVTE